MRTFLRSEVRIQLLGDWLLTLAYRPPPPRPAPPRVQSHPTPPSNGHPTGPPNGYAAAPFNRYPAAPPNGRSTPLPINGYAAKPPPNGHPTPPPNGYSATQPSNGYPATPPANGYSASPANGNSAAPMNNGYGATPPINGHGVTSPTNGYAGTPLAQLFAPTHSRPSSPARPSSPPAAFPPTADPLAWSESPEAVQIDLPAGPKHLIALLALNGRCARIHAAATLWPDCTDAVAAARLRAVLWRLRHRHSGVPPLLDIGDASLALNPDVVVDVHRFRYSAELLIRDPDNYSAEAELAADEVLHSAELLPGWYDDWVLAARERLQYLRLGALDALATRRRTQGRTHEALEAARAAIGIEPLHETAHRAIVETHLDNGDVVEAINHYRRFEATLDHELGLPPSALFREVLDPYLALSSQRLARR